MKKLTRSEKQKIIERVKTFIIFVLSFSCVFLGYHTFELYRDQSGDSLFWSSSGNISFDAPAENNSSLAVNGGLKLSQPELVMINRTESRELIKDDKIFSAVSDILESVLYELNSANTVAFTDISLAEWKNVLKHNSVYARYPYLNKIIFDNQNLDVDSNSASEVIQGYDKIALVSDSKGEELFVFICGNVEERIIKAAIKTTAAADIKKIIDSQADIKSKKYTFAYELNLDQGIKSGNGKSEVILDSMFIIPTEKIIADNIKINVPKIYKSGLDFTKTTDFTRGLINIFGYNPNTVRQYARSDNALIFVGETGSLSVHPQGWIEYKSLGVNEGVQMSKPTEADNDEQAMMSGICKIIERIFEVSGVFTGYSDHTLKLVDITENPDIPGAVKISADYFVDGNRVEFGNSAAIEATVIRGILTDLKMQIRDVRKTDSKTELPPVFDAIDSYCGKNPDASELSTGSIVYKFEENGADISAVWKIEE